MSDQLKQAKKDFSRIGWALLALGLITSILQAVLSIRWAPYLDGGTDEWLMWVITFVPLYLIGMPVGYLVMRTVPAESRESVKLSGKEFVKLMLMCMPIMYGGNILGNLLSGILSGGTAENALLDYITGNPLLTMLVAVLIAPAAEEFLFRKQIIDRLGKYGEKTAMLFSAMTFGLFHMNLFQFFYAFGLGLLFAYVYTRTRMLRYPVIMHMIINFMGSVIAPLLLTVIDFDALTALESGQADMAVLMNILPGLLLYMVYFLVLMGSVVAGLVLLIIHRKKWLLLPASQELPEGTEKKTAYGNVGMVLFIGFCAVMIVFSLISGLL